MDIYSLGKACVRIKTKTATVLFNPSADIAKTESDVVVFSTPEIDDNFLKKVSGYTKILSRPGEYDVKEVSFIGVKLLENETSFMLEAEDLNLAYIKTIPSDLKTKQLEPLGDLCDVLIISLLDNDAKKLAEIVEYFEPAIVVPINYADQASLDKLLKEINLPVETLNKVSIKKIELSESQKVIVLK